MQKNRFTYNNTLKEKIFFSFLEDYEKRVLQGKSGVNYYKHGPLARTELGDEKVQAMDYAYTIQGWIKGVNSNTLNETNDIGHDGKAGTINANFAKDAFGYSLGYYNGDYKSIGGTTTDNFLASVSGSAFAGAANDLFNGNIRHMVTAISNTDGTKAPVQGTAYHYDQLNRIKQMQAYRDFTVAGGDLIAMNNSFTTATNNTDYQTNLTYDANGNILTNVKKGVGGTSTNSMDDLHYKYIKNTNKLSYVTDLQTNDGNYATDIDNQNVDNYTYDEIGNLNGDVQEQIQNIEWTVYGKVKKVTRTTGSTKDDLEFMYDASGNRVAKIKKPHATLSDPNTWITTFYVRDASGNIMATYDKTHAANADVITLDEQYIYGSSRLGLLTRALDLNQTPEANKFSRTLGQKQFEMTNHLGNVLTVVSDRKITHTTPSAYGLTGINQDFNDGIISGWVHDHGITSLSNSNNRLQITNSDMYSAPYCPYFSDLIFPSGSLGGTYSITFDLEAASAMTVKCRIWDVDDNWHLIKEETYNIGSSSATYSINFSTSTATLIDFYSTTGGTFYIDNIKDTPPVPASYTADVKSSSDYYAGGMPMPGRQFNPTEYRFGMNTQEKVDEISGSGNHYTALFWEYDPRTGRRWNLDPKPDAWESPYVAFADNPIKFTDILGDTEDERKKAVAKAKDYKDKSTGTSSSYGGKGEPGKAVDCSGLVSGCVKSADLPDPNSGSSNGVSNIANNSTKVDWNDVQEGNAVTFNSNKHIGIISGNIEKDKDGNVTSFSVIGSQSSTGPGEFTVFTDKSSSWTKKTSDGKTNDGYWSPKLGAAYKWDTPDAPALSNGNSATVQESTTTMQPVTLAPADNTKVVIPIIPVIIPQKK